MRRIPATHPAEAPEPAPMLRPLHPPSAPLRRPRNGVAGVLLVLLAGGACEKAVDDTDTTEVTLVDDDGDGWAIPQDCDDDDDSIHPGATEFCGNVDEDCDGVLDDNPLDGVTAWLDMDADGWGDPTTRSTWCGDTNTDARPWVSNSGDCDDGDATRSPSGLETCARAGDEDCDGNDNDADAIGCTRWYEDRDGDGIGSELSTCLCVAEGNWRASLPGDCDDADATRTEGCGLYGAIAASDADVVVYGSTGTAGAGVSLAPGGDADADGWPDLLIAASDTTSSGRWWLLRGPFASDRDLAAPSATFHDGLFQRPDAVSVAGGGDLDGDGVDDIVLGVFGRPDASSQYMPVVYVVPGPVNSDVDVTSSVALYEGTHSSSAWAFGAARIADSDADGVDELLVTDGIANTVYLLAGPLAGALSPNDAVFTLRTTGLQVPASVADGGDLDGDGLPDLVVGSPAAASTAGAAWVIAGGTIGTVPTADADVTITSDIAFAQLGTAVAGAGDVDGDGHADLLVSAVGATGQGTREGAVWLFSGPLASTLSLGDAVAEVDGRDADGFASTIAPGGDIDGDGHADLLIGAPGVSTVAPAAGAAYLFFGPLTGTLLTTEGNARIYGDAEGDQLGASVAGLGDLDADGYDDFALGAPRLDLGGTDLGGAFVFHGASE